MTRWLKRASLEEARKNERPFVYLPSSNTHKEQVALRVLEEKPVEQGLSAVISSTVRRRGRAIHVLRHLQKRSDQAA